MKKNPIEFFRYRYLLVLGGIGLLVLGLAWRVFDLAILNQHFLRQQGDERVLRLVSTPAFRGMIVDRNGFPLAMSTRVYSVWMNPAQFHPDKKTTQHLADLLGVPPKNITQLVTRYEKSKREFVYLKRAVLSDIALPLKAEKIPGLNFQQEYRRYYPEGETAAHLVGFNNIDDRGQEGMELAYNDWLSGEPGKKWVVKDRLGRIISDVQKVQDQKPGHDLTLSIDRRIQYIAYRELATGVAATQADSGSVVVLDSRTGEVLAMANFPSFDPNNRQGVKRDALRNRVVTDTFEPGSTIKAFSVAVGLAAGHIKPDSVIDTYPGWMRVGHNLVRDEHSKGEMTVTKILQISSNVGVTKIILDTPPNSLWTLLHGVGFGELTGSNFPGEQSGSLMKHDPWGSFTLATLSFGYGMSSTLLQLARAYSVIANDGVKRPISLLRLDEQPKGELVMVPAIARSMRELLESVLSKGGTGEMANVPGYRISGKTGTAIKAGNRGYQKHHYTASFVGIAPASNPRLIIAVVIHEPQGKVYYGGLVSGPVFERIAESVLRLMDVPPDKPDPIPVTQATA